jgi:hypothetical protein
VTALDGTNVRKIAPGTFGPTSWSSDGRLLTATDGLRLILVHIDATAPSMLFASGRAVSAAFNPR